MKKKTKNYILLILCTIGIFAAIALGLNGVNPYVAYFLGVVNLAGVVASIALLDKAHDDRPITNEELQKLTCVGREQDGSYSDRWQVDIKPVYDNKKDKNLIKWAFCLFDETDGKTFRVKYVETMSQLKKIYEAVTDNKLS